jgi:hypothetical protein
VMNYSIYNNLDVYLVISGNDKGAVVIKWLGWCPQGTLQLVSNKAAGATIGDSYSGTLSAAFNKTPYGTIW